MQPSDIKAKIHLQSYFNFIFRWIWSTTTSGSKNTHKEQSKLPNRPINSLEIAEFR